MSWALQCIESVQCQKHVWLTTALLARLCHTCSCLAGGFYDHVPPPTNVPSPDGINATDDPFDFTRLGVRVPSLLVSPWVPKGAAVQHVATRGHGGN